MSKKCKCDTCVYSEMINIGRKKVYECIIDKEEECKNSNEFYEKRKKNRAS